MVGESERRALSGPRERSGKEERAERGPARQARRPTITLAPWVIIIMWWAAQSGCGMGCMFLERDERRTDGREERGKQAADRKG